MRFEFSGYCILQPKTSSQRSAVITQHYLTGNETVKVKQSVFEVHEPKDRSLSMVLKRERSFYCRCGSWRALQYCVLDVALLTWLIQLCDMRCKMDVSMEGLENLGIKMGR